jgi:hypothetical protein
MIESKAHKKTDMLFPSREFGMVRRRLASVGRIALVWMRARSHPAHNNPVLRIPIAHNNPVLRIPIAQLVNERFKTMAGIGHEP